MKSKTCSNCNKRKPAKKFGIGKANKDGLQRQCKECRKKYAKEHYEENPEKFKQIVKKYRAKWLEDNPGKLKEIKAKYWARTRQTFWGYYNNIFSNLLSMLIRGTIKTSPTLEWVLGCSSQQIVDHIISQLKPGMTLANYGKVWEMDHIISKAILRYESFEDPNFRKLWCLENLRPLWKEDN